MILYRNGCLTSEASVPNVNTTTIPLYVYKLLDLQKYIRKIKVRVGVFNVPLISPVVKYDLVSMSWTQATLVLFNYNYKNKLSQLVNKMKHKLISRFEYCGIIKKNLEQFVVI